MWSFVVDVLAERERKEQIEGLIERQFKGARES
jgi:hypothetical protein